MIHSRNVYGGRYADDIQCRVDNKAVRRLSIGDDRRVSSVHANVKYSRILVRIARSRRIDAVRCFKPEFHGSSFLVASSWHPRYILVDMADTPDFLVTC